MKQHSCTNLHAQTGLMGRFSMLAAYRELTWMLAWRDIRVRYKHSALGAAWAIIPPVVMMIVFAFVFGTVSQLDPRKLTGHDAMPYSLFALSGLVPWMFFSNSLTAAITSLVSNRQLITKIYFPREVFPIAAVVSTFVDFLIATAMLFAFALYTHFRHGWELPLAWPLLALPAVVAVQIILTIGLGLILSMANLFYRDVGFLFRSLIQLWMFVTCVVYQLDPAAAWKRTVIQLNPMTPIIQAYRDCLIIGRNPFNAAFAQAAAVSIAVLAIGWASFARREFEFAEHA